jgi:two-component system response regulator DevR
VRSATAQDARAPPALDSGLNLSSGATVRRKARTIGGATAPFGYGAAPASLQDTDEAGSQGTRDERRPPTDRVFLLDHHEVARRGITGLLHDAGGITVVGEASTATGALARVPAVRPDVALLGLHLPDGDGVTVCRELRALLPELQVVILTGYDDDALVDAVLAGASAYLHKDVPGEHVVRAVRTVAAGGSLLDPAAVTAALERSSAEANLTRLLATLTPRERAVFELLGEGLTNRQIGARLHLREKTVKNYVTGLLGKLGLQRRTQATVLAVRRQPDPAVPLGTGDGPTG